MPSPVGHSLLGLALAAGFALPRFTLSTVASAVRRHLPEVSLLLVAANLPDVDYVPGLIAGELNKYHHLHTHTLGWVVVTSLGLWWIWKRIRPDAGWSSLALLFVAGMSHLLADLVTADTRAPFGIMALWPFSSAYFISPMSLFMAPRKATVGDMFQLYNVRVMLVEAAWCLPLVLLGVWSRYRSGRPAE